MIEEDDLGGDGETAGGGAIAESNDASEEHEALAVANTSCLSCGASVAGVFCATCGQKQDDLRRSLFLLARDFVEDTFAFDSRMWRTLGLLAVSPGVVPTQFSHGRRSQFTPPIRLFLVVSFLFFLTVGLTNTLFVGVQVNFTDSVSSENEAATGEAMSMGAPIAQNTKAEDVERGCGFQANLRFFIKEKDLIADRERLEYCLNSARDEIKNEIATNDEIEVQIGDDEGAAVEKEQAGAVVERIFEGIRWSVANPREFNSAINVWLPRVMFLMTPILALILAMYLRRDVYLFDHMVLSLYVHAVNFVIVGASLILTQLGAPLAGYAAVLLVSVYYVVALKRAYKRGWVKTLWTALSSSSVYGLIFFIVLMTIVSRVVWGATG